MNGNEALVWVVRVSPETARNGYVMATLREASDTVVAALRLMHEGYDGFRIEVRPPQTEGRA
jgi:RNase P/RNase MRP subunit POP5